jgi:hypothetical protein
MASLGQPNPWLATAHVDLTTSTYHENSIGPITATTALQNLITPATTIGNTVLTIFIDGQVEATNNPLTTMTVNLYAGSGGTIVPKRGSYCTQVP